MDAPHGGAFLTGSPDAERVFTPEQLSSEARLMGRTMEEFVRSEVLPRVERLEAHDDALLRALVQNAGDLGLLMGAVPEAYGGLGLPKSTLALLSEKAAANASFAITIGVHSGIALLPLLYFGTEAQKQRYLPKLASGEIVGAFCISEAGSGSDALAASTKAVLSADGSHYLLTGTKMWITNAAIAGLFTVFAQVDGEKLTAFLVDRDSPGLSLGREEEKLGLRGSSTRRVILDDCPVPVGNVLGDVGKGYRPALYCLNMGRFNIGASALGSGKDCLRIAARYASQRRQFGREIAEFGAIQSKLAEMAVRLFVLESMVYRTAGYWDILFDGIDPASPDAPERWQAATEEYAMECAMIKFNGTETLAYVVDEALQIHGGYGYSEEYPVARQYRDARVSRIYEGTNEINRLTVADQIVKRAARGRLPLADSIAQARLDGKPDDDAEDPMDRVRRLREVTVFVLGRALERLKDGSGERQQVAMDLADLCAMLYGYESAALRALRLKETTQARELAMAAVELFGRYVIFAVLDKADSILASVEDAERATADFERARRYLESQPMDRAALRRRIAEAVSERGGYPWGS